MTPAVSRTRFSRATRSPLKYDVEFDALPMMEYQNSIGVENIDERFTDKGVSLKHSFGNKNRCKTCNKVSGTAKSYFKSHFTAVQYGWYEKRFAFD